MSRATIATVRTSMDIALFANLRAYVDGCRTDPTKLIQAKAEWAESNIAKITVFDGYILEEKNVGEPTDNYAGFNGDVWKRMLKADISAIGGSFRSNSLAQTFTKSGDAERKLQNLFMPDRFSCGYPDGCKQKACSQYSHMKAHFSAKHRSTKYKCTLCGKETGDRSFFIRHTDEQHGLDVRRAAGPSRHRLPKLGNGKRQRETADAEGYIEKTGTPGPKKYRGDVDDAVTTHLAVATYGAMNQTARPTAESVYSLSSASMLNEAALVDQGCTPPEAFVPAIGAAGLEDTMPEVRTFDNGLGIFPFGVDLDNDCGWQSLLENGIDVSIESSVLQSPSSYD